MDDFDTFKASREKIDPSTRKFSESQWQQAYAAYRNTRERKHAQSGEGSRRRRSASKKRSSRHDASSMNPAVNLRNEVRQNSAYSDLRMLVDLLAWIAIGVVVLAGVFRVAYYTSGSAALASIMDTALQVIAVVVLRLLVQVIIDLPDLAIRRHLSHSPHSREDEESDD